jgi:hypothetical protein
MFLVIQLKVLFLDSNEFTSKSRRALIDVEATAISYVPSSSPQLITRLQCQKRQKEGIGIP